MKKHYFLRLLQGACFMLLSLFLQSCGGLGNLPLEGEEELTTIEREEQGRRKRARIEIEQEQSLIEQAQEMNSLDIFPSEIWQEIFSYLKFEDILPARAVNRDWNQLITGYREAGIVGLENKPQHIIDARGWTKKSEISYELIPFGLIGPEDTPSFAFYRLMGIVEGLTLDFGSYLKYTNIHTLSSFYIDDAADIIQLAEYLKGAKVHTLGLNFNDIGEEAAAVLPKLFQGTNVHKLCLDHSSLETSAVEEILEQLQGTSLYELDLSANEIGHEDNADLGWLVKCLQETNIHTLNLSKNRVKICDPYYGSDGFAQHLPKTKIHTLNLSQNLIDNNGVRELAKHLPETRIHTLYLENNEIYDGGVRRLAKHLPKSKVHTLSLRGNAVGDIGISELAKCLPQTQIHTLNLRNAQISNAGAIELTKYLSQNKVHILDLRENYIDNVTQQLLKTQFPYIKWVF
jgi:hypothetical protein